MPRCCSPAVTRKRPCREAIWAGAAPYTRASAGGRPDRMVLRSTGAGSGIPARSPPLPVKSTPANPRRLEPLYLAVFLSGAAGLAVEVVFTRRLVQVFGSTSEAVSTVLAAFMGGFALGAWIWGRRADRSARPARVYAVLELLIGASSALIFAVLPALQPLFESVYALAGRGSLSFTLVRFAVLFVLLALPATGMGATLPVLAAALGDPRAAGRTVGRLYALNTAGAVVGTVAAGFVLVEALGLTRTILAAAACNALAALIAWVSAPAASLPREDEGTAAAPPSPLLRPAVVAAFVSGFASLGFEVVWTRILILYITATTYAFSTMLATFLVGITLGSWLFARRADLERHPLLTLALCHAAAAVMAPGVVAILALFPQGRVYPRPEGPSWIGILLMQVAQCVLVMLPPTFCLGGAFPLACRLVARPGSFGRDVGRVYTANTAGAILGSLAAGFVLVPRIGLAGANRALAGVLVLSAAWLLRKGGAALPLALVPPGALLLMVVLLPSRALVMDLDPGQKAVFYEEASAATVAVVEEKTGERRLLIDNIFVAGSHSIMLTDQKSLAHVPCLLHPDPARVLTIGFGSGGASHSFTLYDEVKEVEAVEIVPEVLDASDRFPSVNHGVTRHPKFRAVLDDAKSYLSLSRGPGYDVITSDCTDLSYRANADLYQREFFETCARRLNPGGIMCVWLPLRHLSRDDFATALDSFLAAFPDGTLWYMLNFPTHYVLLVGTDGPLSVDLPRLSERLRRPAIRTDLAEIGLTEPLRFASCLLLGPEGMKKLVAGAVPHTEDHPRLEFTVPRFDRGVEREYENLEEMLAFRTPLADVLPELARRKPGLLMRQDASARALLQGHVAMLKREFRVALRAYALAAMGDPAAKDVARLISFHERALEALLQRNPGPDADVDRAHLAFVRGKLEEASQLYAAVLGRGIRPAECHLGLAVVQTLRGEEGREHFERAAAEPGASPLVVEVARGYLEGSGGQERALH